jgi:CheY-like chemotaxis protein
MSESKLNGLRILSASVDANLNQTRALILQDHGFDVTTSESLEDATQRMERQQFDVLIFGSTLPRDTCWKLAEVFRRRNASGKIIEVLPSPWAAPKNRPDATVISSDEPTKLVDAILERIM